MSDSGVGSHGEDSRAGINEKDEDSAAETLPKSNNTARRNVASNSDINAAGNGDPSDSTQQEIALLTRGLRFWARVAAAAAAVSAIVALGQCIEMNKQATIMSSQLSSMNVSGNDTHNLALAARDQAVSTSNLVKAQRPWVIVTGIVHLSDHPLISGEPFRYLLEFMNPGHSPATNIKWQINHRIIPVRKSLDVSQLSSGSTCKGQFTAATDGAIFQDQSRSPYQPHTGYLPPSCKGFPSRCRRG